jgi:hypothetical protein
VLDRLAVTGAGMANWLSAFMLKKKNRSGSRPKRSFKQRTFGELVSAVGQKREMTRGDL